jgi:hypothetical protein
MRSGRATCCVWPDVPVIDAEMTAPAAAARTTVTIERKYLPRMRVSSCLRYMFVIFAL